MSDGKEKKYNLRPRNPPASSACVTQDEDLEEDETDEDYVPDEDNETMETESEVDEGQEQEEEEGGEQVDDDEDLCLEGEDEELKDTQKWEKETLFLDQQQKKVIVVKGMLLYLGDHVETKDRKEHVIQKLELNGFTSNSGAFISYDQIRSLQHVVKPLLSFSKDSMASLDEFLDKIWSTLSTFTSYADCKETNPYARILREAEICKVGSNAVEWIKFQYALMQHHFFNMKHIAWAAKHNEFWSTMTALGLTL
jgi:hypothetical protein